MLCEFCKKPVDLDNTDNYREVVSWVTGKKLDGPVLRRQTGLIAHHECIKKQILGQAPDQEQLLSEDEFPEDQLTLSLSPGDILNSSLTD